MVQKTGIGVSPGAVIAEAAVLRHSGLGVEHTTVEDIDSELAVFSSALNSAFSSLDATLVSSEDEKAMLMTLRAMLSDPEYTGLIKDNIKERN